MAPIRRLPARPRMSGVFGVLLACMLIVPLLPVAAQSGGYTPRFEPAACAFELPDGLAEGQTVECGYLIVPEDRTQPDARTIRLAVAIFHHAGDPVSTPVVYLEGGPGSSALEFIRFGFAEQFAPLLAADHDVIVFDQRGVGLSEPALDCPAYDTLLLETLDFELDGRLVTAQERAELAVTALLACSESLRAAADLAAYHTAANADDIDDLRHALGYAQVNLWGISYGTRLALSVLRFHPEGVRSVVLDSVFPPDVNLQIDAPGNARRAFDVLFANCAADPLCALAYPDLEATFWATVDRLNAEPASLTVSHVLTRATYPAVLDGDTLVGTLFRMMYVTDFWPLLPGLIESVSAGRYEGISQIIGLHISQQESMSTGMYFSVECHDDMPFGTRAGYDAALEVLPELAGFFRTYPLSGLATEICAAWGAGEAAPVANEAVSSDVPTLVMAGEYDPITPPAWAELAASTLSHSYFYTYPGVAHGASPAAACPMGMMLDFLADPDTPPDDACIAAMAVPAFVVPEQIGLAEPVTLEPFEMAETGLRGLIPAGWQAIDTGVLLRANTPLDNTGLIVQAVAVDLPTMLAALSDQIGLRAVPQQVDTRVSDWYSWRLYRVEVAGGVVDLALAERGGRTAVVLLASETIERDALYQAVFVPVVDALEPLE
ncbi:MAG: alpha/beta fold hydrolase [Anaerolineae bacterium]|nr:alpha/beta fold hydrolase [Anaerolineae bacterium]